jgi:ABC-type multidrug transport system permease subunit
VRLPVLIRLTDLQVSSQHRSPLISLTLARLREFYRQPEAVFWVYFFPILMVVALGVAFRNKPIEKITVDAVRSTETSELGESLVADPRVNWQLLNLKECQDRLRTGKSDLYLIGLPGSESPQFEYVFDPSRPGSLVARDTVNNLVQRSFGRYIDFLVPGLIGMGLMGGGLWGVGFAIVDMRIRSLLKRFMATPMKKSHFLMGIMASRLMFMIPEILMLIVFAHFAFGVQIYGNWFAIIALVLIGAIEFSGIGLLVASRAKTLESVSGLMNLVMLPMCGIFFSYERFPAAIQPAIRLLPLTPLNDALRAVMLDGASLASQWPQLLVMAVWGIATFALALVVFRWIE